MDNELGAWVDEEFEGLVLRIVNSASSDRYIR
jgi:hypothetical protein